MSASLAVPLSSFFTFCLGNNASCLFNWAAIHVVFAGVIRQNKSTRFGHEEPVATGVVAVRAAVARGEPALS